MQRFRGGLVSKAHRRLYHSTLGLRVIKQKKSHERFELRARNAPPWPYFYHLLLRSHYHIVQEFGFRVSGFGFRGSGWKRTRHEMTGFRVVGLGFQVSGFGFRVSGFGFRGYGAGRRQCHIVSSSSSLLSSLEMSDTKNYEP